MRYRTGPFVCILSFLRLLCKLAVPSIHRLLTSIKSTSIDVHPSGLYLLVGQQGGEANLITLRPNECKGSVERVYTSAKLQSMTTLGFPAVFATNGQAVLYGTVNGCALVWDRKKGAIVYGLKHPEGTHLNSSIVVHVFPAIGTWSTVGKISVLITFFFNR